MRIIQFLLCIFVTSISFSNVETHFATIKSNPHALYAFFKEMPKSGELHYHLAGGAYPEAMLALAIQNDYCLAPDTQTMNKPTATCDGIKASTLVAKPNLYNQVIRAWSMKDFLPGKESRHDHFFATFYKFFPIVVDFQPQLLAEVIKRAANQHELYLEIMILPDIANSATFGQKINGTQSFAEKQHTLLGDKNFKANISHTVAESERILQQARKELGCDALPNQPACTLTVKFQYYLLREQPLNNVFAQALNGFAAASRSNDIVGVNLVQPEDGIISLRDYREQMRILKFLHQAYPNVHIALHAGELAPDAVSPDELRFHIRDAIYTGQASRIGHGVDIAHEDKAEHLLNFMAKKPIAVEINLTSNRKILTIEGKAHPLNYYLAHHVPVVLSTDDEGILRTDLTSEYVEAVMNHDLDYPTIKTINRNTLTYSFMPGRNLWSDPNASILVPACQDLNSVKCLQFIKENPKARLQWTLEKKLGVFELSF